MKFCLFILSACHSNNRNIIEWKRREIELYRTIEFHETKYKGLKIFILDSTIIDDKIFYPNLIRRVVEYNEFGYSLDTLKLKNNSTDILMYTSDLNKICQSYGFSSYFAIFSGNYLANININYFENSTNTERFMIYDYDNGLEILNDEVIFSSYLSQDNEYSKKSKLVNRELIIFNVLKNLIS